VATASARAAIKARPWDRRPGRPELETAPAGAADARGGWKELMDARDFFVIGFLLLPAHVPAWE